MKKKEIIKQLKELVDDRKSFIGNDKEINLIYTKDINALEKTIKIVKNIDKNNIEKLILNFIGSKYGSQEMEDPCYNIDELSKYLCENLRR